jgi:DNA-binding transcriptional regulator YhcF (GntR family)
MFKKELIWREIAHQAIENNILEFTQSELAKKYGFSLSTVFHALKILRSQGAIKVTGRNFTVVDAEKLLYIWATQRDLEKDIIYQTRVEKNVKEIEGEMPSGIIFAAFSAFAQKYNEAPADYDKVYVYSDETGAAEIKKRFPLRQGAANLFVLKKDSQIKSAAGTTADVQTFVDLWNVKDWYAKDYLKKLQEKMF